MCRQLMKIIQWKKKKKYKIILNKIKKKKKNIKIFKKKPIKKKFNWCGVLV